MGRVTMEDVAREAGVSRALVSIAFRDVPGVSAATREQIFEAAAKLGYRPNVNAARLASRRTRTHGVVIPDRRNAVVHDYYEGVREAADLAKYLTVVGVSSADGSRDRATLEELLDVQVDALVVPGLNLPEEIFREVATGACPIVLAGREIAGFDSVLADARQGATLAVEHLLELGHRRIAHIAPPADSHFRHRTEAYTDIMRARGLTPRVVHTGFAQAAAAQAAGELLDSPKPPTAIFANNDVAALGVLDALAERGLRAPEDVSVVGHDNTATSAIPSVALTTVDQQAQRIGRLAGELALRRVAEPGAQPMTRILEPFLVVRGSSGPPKG